VALIPLRRRVWFLLDDAVSSYIFEEDSKTKCLLEEVVEMAWKTMIPCSW
jgi:hypothetical protein